MNESIAPEPGSRLVGQNLVPRGIAESILSGVDDEIAGYVLEDAIERGDVDPATIEHQGGVVGRIRPEKSLWDVINARNNRLCEFLEQSPGAAGGVQKLVVGLEHFARRKGVGPDEVGIGDCRFEQTAEGGNLVMPFIVRRK